MHGVGFGPTKSPAGLSLSKSNIGAPSPCNVRSPHQYAAAAEERDYYGHPAVDRPADDSSNGLCSLNGAESGNDNQSAEISETF